MTTLLVDLSSVFWPCVLTDVASAHDLTVAAVRAASDGKRTIVCLDSQQRGWRSMIYPEYKANRPEKDLSHVVELKRTIASLKAQFEWAGADGLEADDVIASLCNQLEEEIVIASQDKDLAQLVCKRVTLLSTRDGRQRGHAEIMEKYGVRPGQIVDYLSLTGDAADNIPGCRGIGEVTARKLLSAFQSVAGIYEAIRTGVARTSGVCTPAMVTKLINGREDVELSRRLATLNVIPMFINAPTGAGGTATVTTAQPQPMPAAGRLAAVKRGTIESAYRFMFYGDSGVGKTTLASGAPDPIWLDIEGGSGQLDVPRYPFGDGANGHVPRSFTDVLEAMRELATAQHAYRTVVIDTIDRLEYMAWEYVCKRDGKASIEEYGFGKGYNAALDAWKEFVAAADAIHARGVNVIMIAHSYIRTFRNPDGDDYDRYQMRVHERASNLLRDWCDVVGFVTLETFAKRTPGAIKAKGLTSGRRVMHTQKTAAFDAKSRLPLASEVEIPPSQPWRPLAEAIAAVSSATPAALRSGIEAELARIGDRELASRVQTVVAAANDNKLELIRYLNSLKQRPSIKQEVANAQ